MIAEVIEGVVTTCKKIIRYAIAFFYRLVARSKGYKIPLFSDYDYKYYWRKKMMDTISDYYCDTCGDVLQYYTIKEGEAYCDTCGQKLCEQPNYALKEAKE